MTMMTPMGRGGRMYPRSRRWPRVLAGFLVIALLAAAGGGLWWWLTRDDASVEPKPNATKTCRTPTPSLPRVMPAPEDVDVDVANGTDQSGLAIQTADTLITRGFMVVGIGNTDSPVKQGVAQIRYAPAQYRGAILLASYVPGSKLVAEASVKGGVVELWVGPDFDGVSTSKQADVSAVTLPSAAPICKKLRAKDRTSS